MSGGAIDPLADILDAVDAQRAGRKPGALWVHIDGAFGLWARASARRGGDAAGADASAT